MRIWVVRHGSAGRKGTWPGDDDLRPLDELGEEQAVDVADLLADRGPTRLRSSPTRRCVQTMEPLAARVDLPVIGDETLAAGGYPDGLLALLARSGEAGDVVCTHGEVLRPALAELRRRGAVQSGDDAALLAKGGVWELDLAGPELMLL
jgi:phosphohistidine phosphatase SixA